MKTRNIIAIVVALMVVPLVIAACGSTTEDTAAPAPSPTPSQAPKDIVECAFVADNPGVWMFHCHVIDHMETGLMAAIEVV